MRLSKTSEKLLDENGYEVSHKEGVISIAHSNSDQIFFFFMGLFLILMSFVFFAVNYFLGAALFVGSILVISKNLKGSRGKSIFKLYITKGWFYYKLGKSESLSIRFENIESVALNSSFANEYASATKSSSQEYQYQIFLKMCKGHDLELFFFKGDQLEPSAEISKFIEELKTIFRPSL